jgi:hypothetical protein
MRKYLLPGAVCLFLGALAILVWKLGEKPEKPPPLRPRTPATAAVEKPDPIGRPADTPTALDEHKYLRELERALERDDLSHAYDFRQKVCEDMDTILASEKLSRNLLEDIRKYGAESDDPRRRDVVLPMLRVFEHPEATKLIAEEYYQARDEEEQMTLLEAMARPYHDPNQAAVWAVERALNSSSAETRFRAFDVIATYTADDEIVAKVGSQIYDASTDPKQREMILKTVSEHGRDAPAAQEFVRRVLRDAKPEQIVLIMGSIANWGNDDDAARLEALAEEFPQLRLTLREQANLIRNADRHRRGLGPAEPDRPRPEDERPPEAPRDR